MSEPTKLTEPVQSVVIGLREWAGGPMAMNPANADVCNLLERAARMLESVPGILDALRELHDFAERSSHYQDSERSAKAFDRAAELLRLFGV
jgi:hypothetical protein